MLRNLSLSYLLMFTMILSNTSFADVNHEKLYKKVFSILKRRNKKASTAVVGVRKSRAINDFFSTGSDKDSQNKNLKKVIKMSPKWHWQISYCLCIMLLPP